LELFQEFSGFKVPERLKLHYMDVKEKFLEKGHIGYRYRQCFGSAYIICGSGSSLFDECGPDPIPDPDLNPG
jgi:hypothetical protein